MSVRGLDLSSNNGSHIDFHQIRKAGFRFVIIKVTEGTNYVNPYAKRHATEAKAAGLIVGAYAFLKPSGTHTPEAEAAYFLHHAYECGLLQRGCLRPTVDVEVTSLPKGKPSRRYVYRVIEYIIRKINCKPFVYTGSWFWDGVLGAKNTHKCPLWLAAYTSAWRKLIPKSWGGVSIHQETDRGSAHGVSGRVDVDRYLGRDVAMLRRHHVLGVSRRA